MKLMRMWMLIGMALLLAQSAVAHERTWPAKRLKRTWREASKFTPKQVTLSASQIKHLEEDGVKVGVEDRSPTFYFAKKKGEKKGKLETLGVILFIDEYGKNGLMEVSVGMSSDGTVKKLDIWEHSENKRVADKEFLDQFVGKSHSDSFKPGKGYKPIKGAEEASAGVARAVLKALAITDAIFGKEEAAEDEHAHADEDTDHDEDAEHHDDEEEEEDEHEEEDHH